MRRSAGTLLYRRTSEGVQVLLVHPSGFYNRRAAWSIPKGEPDAGEELETAARRETAEETGINPGGLHDLGFADMTRSRKRIYCFAGEAPADSSPCCASWEVDRAEFLPLAEASAVIHQDQRVFIERLSQLLGLDF